MKTCFVFFVKGNVMTHEAETVFFHRTQNFKLAINKYAKTGSVGFMRKGKREKSAFTVLVFFH